MHADQKIVVGPKVDKEDIEVSVTYHLNGYLIPVDENGNEIEYTITVKNSGYISANRVIEDELKGTKYIENSATIDNQKAEPETLVKKAYCHIP